MSLKHLLKGFKLPNEIAFKTLDSLDKDHSSFEVGPFERGFAQTIGNTLRRVLMSSMLGFSVTAVRFTVYKGDGSHRFLSSEYDRIEGVKEDTVDIIDEIKKLRYVIDDDEVSSVTLIGEFKGQCPCRAGDIFQRSGITLLNEDVILFHASLDVHVVLELDIELGRGYLPAEETEKRIDEIGTIPIDAIFSPVENVSMSVENIRIGYRSDYEKLQMTIKTDGTISSADVLARAAKVLKDHMTVFINFDEDKVAQPVEVDQSMVEMQKLLELSIEELELSSRSSNCLRAANIRTIGELTILTEKEIADLPNFGSKSMDEIKTKLFGLGLSLGMVAPQMPSESEA